MELYLIDYNELNTKDILQVIKRNNKESYEIIYDIETNASSFFEVEYKDTIRKGDFIHMLTNNKNRTFIIKKIEKNKKDSTAKIFVKDILNIFDRKVIDLEDDFNKANLSTINRMANYIQYNFKEKDNFSKIKNLEIIVPEYTSPVLKVSTNSENGLFNLHTYINNCSQYAGIRTIIYIKELEDRTRKLFVEFRVEEYKTYNINTEIAEILNVEVSDKEIPISHVEVYIRDTKEIFNLYLTTDKNNRITTDNNDPNRIFGTTETISVETKDKARQEAVNVFKRNRFSHLIEFEIPKSSKLINTEEIKTGDFVNIKIDKIIYESYITGIKILDQKKIRFKAGNLRNTLTDKLSQQNINSVGDKLDLTGGNIKGELKIKNSKVLTEDNMGNIITVGEDEGITKIKYKNKFINLAPIFPIGAIYLSITKDNPSKYFGGTWERVAKGRTLVGVKEEDNDFSTPGKTGGEKEHQIIHDELPRLSFKIPHVAYYDSVHVTGGGFNEERLNNVYEGQAHNITNEGWHKLTTGQNKPHNNLQPYFTVYIWQRTA